MKGPSDKKEETAAGTEMKEERIVYMNDGGKWKGKGIML